jgi:hypothetical protein
MSTKWALLRTIQQERADKALSCSAIADLLEEEGWLDLAFYEANPVKAGRRVTVRRDIHWRPL